MADDVARRYPGQSDISNQFKAGASLTKALADYKAIKDSGGDYTFGELTAKYHDLSPSEHQDWKDDVARHYPKKVQDEIKRHIIHALTNKDEHGREKPIPLSITWRDPLDPKSITCTFTPSPPSYEIVISGFRKPLSTHFADRRGKY